MKRALSPEQMLAAQAEGLAVVSAAAAADTVVAAEAAEVAAVEATEVKAEAATSADTAVVTLLQGQLKEVNASLVQANVDISKLTTQLDSMKAAHDGLVAIAAKSVSNMRVALNLASVDTTKMTAETLVNEHLNLTAQFTASFKAGGVAAVSATEEAKDKSPNVDASYQARLAATQIK